MSLGLLSTNFAARQIENNVERYAHFNHGRQNSMINTGDSGPLGKHSRGSVVCDPYAISFVSVLIGTGGPSHIAWFVVAVIVNSLKGVFFRRFVPHIQKKCRKSATAKPIGMDGDSSSPITCVSGIGETKAPALHFTPSTVFTSCVFAIPVSVLCFAFGDEQTSFAATTKTATIDDVRRTDISDVTATASTLPQPAANVSDDGQHAYCGVFQPTGSCTGHIKFLGMRLMLYFYHISAFVKRGSQICP